MNTIVNRIRHINTSINFPNTYIVFGSACGISTEDIIDAVDEKRAVEQIKLYHSMRLDKYQPRSVARIAEVLE